MIILQIHQLIQIEAKIQAQTDHDPKKGTN
jgi:hypothetical protein